MKSRPLIALIALLASLPPTASHASELDWAYTQDTGPAAWGHLSPAYVLCESGRNQSPVNIAEGVPARRKRLVTKYAVPAIDTFDTGRTLQLRFRPGNVLKLEDGDYQLKQIHFHAPSEHQVNGKSYPVEVHFYHEDTHGNMAVLAVFIQEGKENRALRSLAAAMPASIGMPESIAAPITPTMLMPPGHDFYRLAGSLTTPPCSEGVRWIILKQPISASREQIRMLADAVHAPSNRPVQPLNGRQIIE